MVAQPQPIQCDGMDFPSIKEFAHYYGLNYSKVLYYSRRGFSPERIISLCQFSSASKTEKPTKSGTKRYICEYNGVQYSSLYEAAMDLGFSPNQLYEFRKRNNLTPSEAIALSMEKRKRHGKGASKAAKAVVVEGVEYESREAAARAYNVPCITVYSRMERDGISFEEALLRGKSIATYCPPILTLFPSLRLVPETGLLRQPVLEDMQTSLTFYECAVEPMRDAISKIPALRVDSKTYIYFNVDARGIEFITEMPFTVEKSMIDLLNGAYVATKAFFITGKLYLLTFQIAKEEKQDVKSLLTAFFSHATIRDKFIREYGKN